MDSKKPNISITTSQNTKNKRIKIKKIKNYTERTSVIYFNIISKSEISHKRKYIQWSDTKQVQCIVT